MIDIGFLPDPKEAREGRRELKVVGGTEAVAAGGAVAGGQAVAAAAGGPGPGSAGPAMRGCPKCGQRALIRQEGCDICTSCNLQQVRVRGDPRASANPDFLQDADQSGSSPRRRGVFQILPPKIRLDR